MSLELLPVEPAAAEALLRVADAARAADGADPFDEQARLDLASGRRHGFLVVADGPAGADGAGGASGEVIGGGGEHGTIGAGNVGAGIVGAAIVGAGIVGAGIVGAGMVGAGAIDLVIVPERRREGFGDAALRESLRRLTGPVSAWSHGDHPGAKVLAERHGFDRVRTLLQLELRLAADGSDAAGAGAGAAEADRPGADQAAGADGIHIDAFRAGRDDEEWVGLNARVFAEHPEQGGVTLADLHDRMAEPWFEGQDFLVARDESGRMVGYNWLKIEDAQGTPGGGEAGGGARADGGIGGGETDDGGIGDGGIGDGGIGGGERAGGEIGDGEIYVIGVDAAASGHGLGRVLMRAGLRRLTERGCAVATLYVEGDNTRALGLYRSFGFTDRSVDAQYRRR